MTLSPALMTAGKHGGMDQRLAMSLLVRDEVGLIAHNLAFHRRMGVDHFVVTDNGSVDGTRDLLPVLASQYPMTIIDEPEHTMDQARWVNRMAKIARNLGADWVVNGDADEFWHPVSGSLKTALNGDAGGFICRRLNMLADRGTLADPEYVFYHQTLKVVRPVQDGGERFPRKPILATEFPFCLLEMRPKVMCRLRGLREIEYGNHGARHLGRMAPGPGIEIYHYPIRTYPEFERKVVNHGTSLENSPEIPAHIGWHVRRWYEMYRQGMLRREYEALAPGSDTVARWLEAGTVEVDRTVREICSQASRTGHRVSVARG